MPRASLVPASVCLGCGCTCDDIELVVSNNQIVQARNACTLGQRWYGDGSAPARVYAGGRDATVNRALEEAAVLLRSKRKILIYLAADVSCEAHREAIALADALYARVAGLTSNAMPFVITAQERGSAGATLGEVRNRADTLVFWGVDPGHRYPRFGSRYAVEPPGLHVPEGRRSRTLVAVGIGQAATFPDADIHVMVSDEAEIDLLVAVRSLLTAPVPEGIPDTGIWRDAAALAAVLSRARYATFVVDGEVIGRGAPSRDTLRADALIALAQELNAVTRASLTVLRGGGNRSGAEAVLTAQTGYPASVDFAPGWPTYSPRESDPEELLEGVEAVVIVGAPASIESDVLSALLQLPAIAIGPHASATISRDVHALIDCGTPGIHTTGLVVRMDDVPLMARSALTGPPDAAAIVHELRRLCHG